MILAIPGPVAAAFITITMASIFVIGMKIIVQDGLDYRKGLIAGLGFWIGASFENGAVFPQIVAEFAGGFLQNGMISGGLAATAMTLFVELAKPRRSRIELPFDASALREIRTFVGAFAQRSGWDSAMAERLDAASEETMLTLLHQEEAGDDDAPRRLRLVAYREDGSAVLEFVASKGEANLPGQDCTARGDRRRRFHRTGGVAAAVASPCVLGTPSAVSRHGHRDRACRPAAGGTRRTVVKGPPRHSAGPSCEPFPASNGPIQGERPCISW